MKNKCNTLFFKIIIVVLGAILCLAGALSVLNIKTSQDVFVENFVESQQKIFRQIDENIYELFQNVTAATSAICGSSSVREYLGREKWEAAEEFRNILDVKKILQQQPLAKYSDMSLILVGNNGKTYNYNSTSRLILSGEELLETEIIQQAYETPKKLICRYKSGGYTDVMKSYPVIMMAKAITNNGGKTIDGVILLTIKEKDFRNNYEVFTTSSNDILIFNQDNEIISSNYTEYLTSSSEIEKVWDALEEMQDKKSSMITRQENGQRTVYLMQNFHNTDYKAMGVIHPDQAFESVYDFRYIIEVTVAITAAAILIIFILVRQQTKPLSKLIENMRKVQDGRLDKLVKVEGTQEIRELSATYNDMLGELDNYIQKLMQVEKSKREAEIHSLQMQINPHYIYNTLASVKWLILQPFVENAFFHAFPQGEKGTISIFVRQSDGLLRVEIEDNGIGMSSETLRDLLNKKNASREHFTGIGVNNVDDRMKLIYGENYGILIESQEGRGTKITVCFPLNK